MWLEKNELDCDFRIGEWLVSPMLNQVSRNGSSARLEPKAMRVLVYLAEHPGVVSKEQIIAAVWPDVFVSDDVLAGCISALRKTFGDDARRPRIIGTIHKNGYRMLLPVTSISSNGKPHQPAKFEPVWWQPLTTRFALMLSVIIAVVIVAAAFVWAPSRRRYDSIAVLPFVDDSADPSTEYLSDGIAEQLVNDLSQLSELRVMAWTTASRYRPPQVDPRSAGRDLGVRAVLTGHVSRQADRILLDAELVDVAGGAQLWGKRYQGETGKISGLQQQLSSDLVSRLKIRVTDNDEKKIQRRHSASPAAYELYLEGRFYWGKRTESGLAHAIDFFQRAIQLDPNYALAYSGLADCYNLEDDWGNGAPRDSFPNARAAAEKAISLDDSLAEAHVSLAMVREAYDWDWAGAEQEYKRAIELNPNYTTAHQWYGLFLAGMRRFPEAEIEVRRAQQLDPVSSIVSMAIAEVYTWENHDDAAIAEYKKVIALDPSFAGAHGNIAHLYEKKHLYLQALNNEQQYWVLVGQPDFAKELQKAYDKAGYAAVNRTLLNKELHDREKGRYRSPASIAGMYASLGEDAHAFEWLEKGYEEHSSGMAYLAIDSDFNGIRERPQFQYWLGVLGLPGSLNSTARGPRS